MYYLQHHARGRMRLLAFVGATALLVSAGQADAQQADAVSAQTADASAKPQIADSAIPEVQVTGNRAASDVLPSRPSSSIYGLPQSILDTPRTASEVSASQFQDDAIRTYDDFVRYAPGITRSTGQNVQGAPSIRAGAAEIFQNGQRTFAPNTFHPLNLNAYEGADIVGGPPPVIFGPGTNTGGYVNYLTKQPYFDGQHTEVNTQLGTWVPGAKGTHPDFNWQIDNGGPIIDNKLAYRFSYDQQNGDTYYDNVRNNYYSFYGALTLKANDHLTFDLSTSYDNYYDFNETKGWNRTTQAEIDNGTYYAGRATPIIFSLATNKYFSPVYASGAANSAVIGYQIRTPNAKNQYIAGPVVLGALPTAGAPGFIAGWVYDPTLPGNSVTKLDGTQGLANPNDHFDADQFTLQFRTRYEASDTLTLLNSAYFQSSNDLKNTMNSYWVKYKDDVFEDRFEAQWSTDFRLFGLSIHDDTNSGVSFRHESNTNYTSVYSFVVSPYDLTQPASTQTLTALYGASWPPPAGVPINSPYYGKLVFPAVYPIGGGLYSSAGGGVFPAGSFVQTSDWNETAVFTQHNFKLGDKWGLNVGGRETLLAASIDSPLNPTNGNFHDSHDYHLPAVETSLIYKPVPWSTLYVTYNYSEALNPNSFGNGLSFSSQGLGNTLNQKNFHSVSDTKEVGGKFEVIPGELLGTVALYINDRDAAPDQFNNVARIETKGIESSLRWAINDHLSTGLNYTFEEAKYTNVVPSSFSPNGWVPDNATVFQDSNRLNKVPAGSYIVPGVPKHSVTGYVDYKFNQNFGVTGYVWVTSAWAVRMDQNTIVPTEHDIDLAAYYNFNNWNFRLELLNITNQQNFAPVIGESSEFLQPLQPFAVQAKVKYRF
jgi:outer membrane receptor for monomeric catechols